MRWPGERGSGEEMYFRALTVASEVQFMTLRSIFELFVGFGTLLGQARSPILTRNQAATRFVYQGKPVHPFCLDFPFERSSRRNPIALVTCSDARVPFAASDSGWIEAEYPSTERRGSISYRVLAAAGNRFLVATEIWGGGSGDFSNLFWARLGRREIAVDRDVAGGDRCAGGLSGYTIDGTTLRFNVSTPASDILKLAGVDVADSMLARFGPGYTSCDGEATYHYDLATRKMALSGLTLNVERSPGNSSSLGDSARDTRACFDSVLRQYVRNRRRTLTPQGLKGFGRSFRTRCAQSLSTRSGAALYRIYCSSEPAAKVFADLRAQRKISPSEAPVPPRPAERTGIPAVTIANLADFAAPNYAARLDAWFRSTVVTWGAAVPPTSDKN